jgi:ankyrin repeat protein
VNPDVRDDYGTPGFFWAAAYAEDPRLVRLLLTGKSRVLWRDKDGWTPLMGALHFGNSPEIVSFLVQNSPDGRIRDGAGRNLDVFKSIYEETTPYKAPEALNTLIRQKRVYPVDGIPYDSDLNKALNEVVRWGIDAGMVETLIKAGADPDYIDEEGFTALMAAAAFGSHAMVDALIRNGVSVFDVTNYGWTALHLAAWSSDSQSAALLIREGWDVNVRDFENWTPLMWALRNHASPDYIRILLDAGADPSAQTYRKESGLHLACSGWVPPELESLEMLINAGVDVNSVNNKGETPLLHAAAMGYTEVCQYLLEKGGDPGWINNDGDSAASRAYRNGHYDLAELLELHL